MAEFDIREARADLDRLVDMALAGEDIVITRFGVPLARLVPLHRESSHDRGDSVRVGSAVHGSE